VTHCPQIWPPPITSAEYPLLCNTSAKGGRARSGSLAYQCYSSKHRPWEFYMKGGFMWMYVAPGSGVSINVGRTRSFDSYADAQTFLRKSLDLESPMPPGCTGPARLDQSRLGHLDSIQILRANRRHVEHFSREPRHEVVLLRYPECTSLSSLAARAASHSLEMPRRRVARKASRGDTVGTWGPVACGRWPQLSPCPPNSSVIARLENCRQWDKALAKPLRTKLLAGSCGVTHPSPCYYNGSTYLCSPEYQ